MTIHLKTSVLPPIPSKRYFTVGEVSELCAVEPNVLRYWEQEFPQLELNRRRGRRRYYEREDVVCVRQIRALLYDHGLTIQGARRQLSLQKAAADCVKSSPPTGNTTVQEMVAALKDVLELLD
jgi:DNA-binding transcriptional MerR regulator